VNRLRLHLRSWTWIALVAVLALAWVPTLSRALAPTGASMLTEVCTSQGMTLAMPGGADTDGAPARAGHLLDHCPLCALGLDGAAPLPTTEPTVALPTDGAKPPRLFRQPARTLVAWLGAQARAPPTSA
jgi:hypothetical protein